MKRFLAALSCLLAVGSAALADTAYLDDRSDAASLVRSLYNAVNRHEYARAFDYFSKPPAKSFETYVKGYEGTEFVDVITGKAVADGAAGSTFYSVPTVIRAKDAKGGLSYFSGCYVVRAVNGSVQDPPNRPLQIESAKLKAADQDAYAFFSLPSCGPEGAGAEEPVAPDAATLLASAKDAFVREMGGQCDKAAETAGGVNDPEVHEISFKFSYEGESDPPTIFTLFAFNCSMGAYNAGNVFYGHDKISGLRRLSFAAPHLDIKYEDEEEKTLKSMAVDGFQSDDTLTNAEYNPEIQTISFFAKWRGIGDAASSGDYRFRDGQFVLVSYEVDPTTDEATNPYLLIRDGKVLPAPELVPEEDP